MFGAPSPSASAVTSPAWDSSIQIPLLRNMSPSTLEHAKGTSMISVMVVGDSITQGHEGDWTWRYRLWQWFNDQGVEV